MATIRRDLPLDVPADTAWAAVRDFGQVHRRVAPGFLVDGRLEDGDRIVTFFNGHVARERLVTLDDADRRLAYTIVEGRASHYAASVQILVEGPQRSRLVWTIDFLPDALEHGLAGMVDHALPLMKKTLEG
jgi:hypothetical protein